MLSYVVSKDLSKPVLWLNFDETAVARSPEALRGCVVSRKEWKGQVKGPHRKVRKDRQRGKYTYCATICDNSAVQAVLPQFLIGKSTHLPKKLVKAFHALPSTQLQLLREKSSWVTSETMLQMLKELKQALLPFLGTMRPILLLDCANAHLAKPVIQGAKKNGNPIALHSGISYQLGTACRRHGICCFQGVPPEKVSGASVNGR